MKINKIHSDVQYPCQYDDLFDEKGKLIATIYTEKDAKEDGLRQGVSKGRDGIYNIVTSAKEINNEVVRNGLEELSRKTGKRYEFVAEKTNEDKIIKYAEKLMQRLEKYKIGKGVYDFPKTDAPRQKARVFVGKFSGILYEALTYKDVGAVKSLTDIIELEIAEMIKK